MTPKNFGYPNISGMGIATNIKFDMHIHSVRLNKCLNYFFPKKGRGHVTSLPKNFGVPPNISGTGRATNVKLGVHIRRYSLNKSP